MPLQVIVDENAGPGSKVWEEFCRLQPVGGEGPEYLFLNDSHPGIPDVEILDKLLTPETTLLTNDRVLHMQAIERGFRSYTLNQQGQLTRRRLPGVRTSAPPLSVHRQLQDDYRHQPATAIPTKLKTRLTEKQFKRYRTARRRIRSRFGSAAAISQVAVTIGVKLSQRGLLCGFVFHLSGNSGVPGLRGSEGYCRPAHGWTDPACAVIHALRDQYLLQLEQVHTELFITWPPLLELCCRLQAGDQTAEPLHQVLAELLGGIRQLRLYPCAKGRFFDAMTKRLDQLELRRSNEVTTVDFRALIVDMLGQYYPGTKTDQGARSASEEEFARTQTDL